MNHIQNCGGPNIAAAPLKIYNNNKKLRKE
jgi:hypothetical protein